jgi:Protein of unknown function (DUF2281)
MVLKKCILLAVHHVHPSSYNSMSSTYRLNTDEIDERFFASIKALFPHRSVEISIVPLDTGVHTHIGEQTTATPRFGSAKGRIHLKDDFNEPLEDFQEYMP